MWLEKVYRKRLITSLLQIDGLNAKISKLRYELYDLKKEDCFELCGTCVACKDEGQRLEIKEKEKWYVDEVKTVKAIAGTVVWTSGIQADTSNGRVFEVEIIYRCKE